MTTPTRQADAKIVRSAPAIWGEEKGDATRKDGMSEKKGQDLFSL
jgi:hypothetical protein